MLSLDLQAQSGSFYNERDDQYRLLGLKRAKQAYETSRADYERIKMLHEKGLASQAEQDRAYNNFTDAEVNYQQSLLAVLFEKQYVTVEKAVKYLGRDGRRHVRLTVANASGGSAELYKLVNVDDELFRSLQPDVINNIYVSILNDQNAIISQPYESKISELRYGQPEQLDFILLEDLDAVTAVLTYGSGTQRGMKIFLEKDAAFDRVAVQSEQFSQEVELGQKGKYDLTLELFSGTENTFTLEVANLPKQISRYFLSAEGNVRLRQVRFSESTRTKRAVLEVALPDKPTDEVIIDQPIEFFALIIPQSKAELISSAAEKHWSEEDLKAQGVGYVRLELLPRGIGKLLVRAPQLYQAISKHKTAEMTIDLLNEGRHRLDNIEIKADLPLNWSREIAPGLIQSLAIAQEERVALRFTQPRDIAPGKFDIRLRISAMSGNQPIIVEDKTFTVEITPDSNLIGTLVIVFLLIAVISAVVVFGIRLSRK